MINFTRAFDSAWERMNVILFRPFDLGKWLAMGLSAFLAGLLEGGNGFNGGNYNSNSFNKITGSTSTPPNLSLHQIHLDISNWVSGMQIGLMVLVGLIFTVVIFCVIAVIYWLGARGQFLFLDNVVRNRGAISWPWQTYARLANSLFGFYLLLILISFVIFLPILGVAALMGIPLLMAHRWPAGMEVFGFIGLGGLYVVVAVVLTCLLFVFREFGIPLMFRNGLLARAAFWESMKLLREHTGSVVLFVLLRMAIFIGVAVLSIVVCCATCCIGALPYIGTVFLLPVIVYVKCFTLDCLAQFGPEYDVWTVDVPAVGGGEVAGIPPQV